MDIVTGAAAIHDGVLIAALRQDDRPAFAIRRIFDVVAVAETYGPVDLHTVDLGGVGQLHSRIGAGRTGQLKGGGHIAIEHCGHLCGIRANAGELHGRGLDGAFFDGQSLPSGGGIDRGQAVLVHIVAIPLRLIVGHRTQFAECLTVYLDAASGHTERKNDAACGAVAVRHRKDRVGGLGVHIGLLFGIVGVIIRRCPLLIVDHRGVVLVGRGDQQRRQVRKLVVAVVVHLDTQPHAIGQIDRLDGATLDKYREIRGGRFRIKVFSSYQVEPLGKLTFW